MKRGPEQDVEAIAAAARAAAMPPSICVPLLAIHGERDEVVRAGYAAALVRQYLRPQRRRSVAPGGRAGAHPPPLPTADASRLPHADESRDWRRDGRLVVRFVEVHGLGHAWCGGDASLAFNDAGPPDATALLGEFLRRCFILTFERSETTMAVSGMNHFTVLTDDVPRTVEFYARFWASPTGPGRTSAFPAPGCTRATSPSCTSSAARRARSSAPGVIDHMAFTAKGLADTIATLIAYDIEHICRQQVGTRFWQVFFHDPNGARVELDFAPDEVRTEPRVASLSPITSSSRR